MVVISKSTLVNPLVFFLGMIKSKILDMNYLIDNNIDLFVSTDSSGNIIGEYSTCKFNKHTNYYISAIQTIHGIKYYILIKVSIMNNQELVINEKCLYNCNTLQDLNVLISRRIKLDIANFYLDKT